MGALADFRRATQTDPDDFGAVNELAWLLATCPEQKLRDGHEALDLATANVARQRRAIWLQTLGAAQAETGDFDGAAASEQEAQRSARSALGWVSPRETLINFEFCLNAYRRRMTYAQARAANP